MRAECPPSLVAHGTQLPTLGTPSQNVCSVGALLPEPTGLRGPSWPASRCRRGGWTRPLAPSAAPCAAGTAAGSAARPAQRSGPRSASAGGGKAVVSVEMGSGASCQLLALSSHPCPMTASPGTPAPPSVPSATPACESPVSLALGRKGAPGATFIPSLQPEAPISASAPPSLSARPSGGTMQ